MTERDVHVTMTLIDADTGQWQVAVYIGAYPAISTLHGTEHEVRTRLAGTIRRRYPGEHVQVTFGPPPTPGVGFGDDELQ